MSQIIKISVVAPFFNEGDGVTHFYREMCSIFASLSQYDFELVCVDDGSSDDTLSYLIELANTDNRVKVIEFSRNFGKEAALTAGIDYATGGAVIPIDSDLQDPPELIGEMIELWRSGAEVVLAKRVDRSSDTALKRMTASAFYRIHNLLSSETLIPENVGDFRLMDRVVVDALKRLPERQRFMKGLFAWVGFKTKTLEYVRSARIAGETKFSGWRLWNFALEGITSFSLLPLKVWTYFGLIGAFFAFFYALYIIIRTLIFGVDLPGYASLLVVSLFFGSLQLISLGILGEYIGRIYFESKQRPLYIVRKSHGQSQA
ncbi:glycosyltransferase family 2 protein [Polynucleobacter sp. AP-Kaivos-20-H2]|uniref:glycosyltransferase family 2 protein n=1 Tax=Polynucleobacter sp. AP-Kaivos-20-H2 TaxID=2689104 RepID=UPI001C0AC2A8|nr:glycosyltransferase family 2 protein [Polynucleobacter sp. AP-Kaivos-20-H2]MBU3604088.1 glycosyltransferase family 2 protein [Polynucleobacter sp. AP-Kaivos-20-H2]